MTWHETSKEYQQQDCEGENLLYHDLEVMILPGQNSSLVLFGFLGSHLPPTHGPWA